MAREWTSSPKELRFLDPPRHLSEANIFSFYEVWNSVMAVGQGAFKQLNFCKKGPVWLFRGFVGHEKLPSYVGDYSIINHEIRIPSLKHQDLVESHNMLFSWLTWCFLDFQHWPLGWNGQVGIAKHWCLHTDSYGPTVYIWKRDDMGWLQYKLQGMSMRNQQIPCSIR